MSDIANIHLTREARGYWVATRHLEKLPVDVYGW